MDSERKTEPGSRPCGELGDYEKEKLVNMSIPDLIFELRIATRTKQFDQVEQVLVTREAQLKDEAHKLRQTLDFERLDRMGIEVKLKECQEQCEKRKKGEDLYEKLLANVKKNGLEDTTVEELRAKNSELEGELKIWKEKFLELNERLLKVEHETRLLVKERNNEGNYGGDLGVTLDVKEEKETDGIHVHGGDFGNNNADSNVSQGNGDICAGIRQSSSNPNKDISAAIAAGFRKRYKRKFGKQPRVEEGKSARPRAYPGAPENG
ncbi:uncharacterized protein LOC114726688 isoform X2 [Neltuma alba]|uniref:uncharacterized protein LOC114726688 isoform X2 n=1 Tax=Neltuma alba TaxID=207710 RepID=UPI0010A33B48|nr:uncharacterized protein LOC114726688 isoform X2 [Prosopis alba]